MMECRIAGTVITLAVTCAAVSAQTVERDPHGIFGDGQLEVLFEEGFFTEGPAMGPDGLLYFSDITWTSGSGMQAGHIWRLNLASGQAEIFRSPSGMSNGLLFDLEGRLVAALGADFGGRAVVRTDLSTGRSVILAGLYEERRLNSPNDLAIDEQGRVYFTDPRYRGHEPIEQPVMGVYRIDPDGSVTRILDQAGRPNGILVSPDQTTLYVASVEGPAWAGLNVLLAYDLGEDGTVSGRRIFIDFRPDAGPDGMAIDVQGNLYATRPAADPGVYVYSPEGEELAFLRTPALPTNAAFGTGDYSRTLFVTAGTGVYSINTSIEGYNASARKDERPGQTLDPSRQRTVPTSSERTRAYTCRPGRWGTSDNTWLALRGLRPLGLRHTRTRYPVVLEPLGVRASRAIRTLDENRGRQGYPRLHAR
jgi:gluconolactonase